jgi:transcriptional regulator with GAF, ATPase, and Fis domain
MIEIVALSDAMREAVGLAERVATTDANVLVTGESGAGKDALAAFIHSRSPRAAQPLVKIDCATLPGELLESELFGYERGAFTGATEAKPGRLEAAHRGTLVLDEIAYLTMNAQAKLLRVIENREFERLGGRKTIEVDARLIALTNADLRDAVERRAFPQGQHDRLELTLISCGQQLNEHHFGTADRQIANYMEHSDLAFCHTHQSLCEIIRARLSGLEEADVPGGFLFPRS